MQSNWKTVQQQAGAVIDNDMVLHYGDAVGERRAAVAQTVLADLSALAIIRVRGADAEAFLQSQFSNDIKQVKEQRSQISSYCTPKGRMMAVLRILRDGEDYLLLFPKELQASLLPRLQMYVMRSKVSFTPEEQWLAFGLAGNNAAAVLTKADLPAPINNHDSAAGNGIHVVAVDGETSRFLIVGPETGMTELWSILKNRTQLVGVPVWRWLDIQSGIPTVFKQTAEAFVPQMANLGVLEGVNFKKGCYPGQEIVARMQYLGKLKQRMYLLHGDFDKVIQPGDKIFAQGFGSQSAGTVVDAQPGTEGGYDMLAVVQIKCAESYVLHIGSGNGPILNISKLPYSFPATKDS